MVKMDHKFKINCNPVLFERIKNSGNQLSETCEKVSFLRGIVQNDMELTATNITDWYTEVDRRKMELYNNYMELIQELDTFKTLVHQHLGECNA